MVALRELACGADMGRGTADAKEQLDEQEKEAREGIRETTVTRLRKQMNNNE